MFHPTNRSANCQNVSNPHRGGGGPSGADTLHVMSRGRRPLHPKHGLASPLRWRPRDAPEQ